MQATPNAPADELELNCPLCGYDLRGLPSERCPECGHAFDAEKLRQAKLEHREWFFEHAKRRHISAFLATTSASLRPIKFWGVVAAAHHIVPSRLVVWLIIWATAALLLVVGAGSLAIAEQSAAPRAMPIWNRSARMWATMPPAQTLRGTWNSWYDWALYLYDARDLYSPLVTLAQTLAWPFLAFGILQLFGTTLRKGGVHAGHLWRCTFYALPSLLIPAAGFAAVACNIDSASWQGVTQPLFDRLPKFVYQMIELLELSQAAAIVLGWCGLISTVHLAAAHVRYLRLPHAIAQALLVQTVVALLMIVLLVFGANDV